MAAQDKVTQTFVEVAESIPDKVQVKQTFVEIAESLFDKVQVKQFYVEVAMAGYGVDLPEGGVDLTCFQQRS